MISAIFPICDLLSIYDWRQFVFFVISSVSNNLSNICHFIFVQAGYDLVQRIPGLPALARIALIACGAFAVSWAVVRLMQRWSVTRRLVE